jgi:hypothetical protein
MQGDTFMTIDHLERHRNDAGILVYDLVENDIDPITLAAS